MPTCDRPLSDDVLIEYWVGETTPRRDDDVEAHLFRCGDCTARLASMAALAAGLGEVVRRGRLSGVLSRSVVNRLQREGVRIRQYVLAPGDRVPCAVFPDDDLVITVLRADFSAGRTVSITASASGSPVGRVEHVEVPPGEQEILWSLPAAFVRDMPTVRLEITLSPSDGGDPLGEYQLEHTRAD